MAYSNAAPAFYCSDPAFSVSDFRSDPQKAGADWQKGIAGVRKSGAVVQKDVAGWQKAATVGGTVKQTN
jgi:hypothetical protein